MLEAAMAISVRMDLSLDWPQLLTHGQSLEIL